MVPMRRAMAVFTPKREPAMESAPGVKDGLPGVTGRISYADTADDTDVWIQPGRQGVI